MIVALYSKEMFLFPFITDNSFLFTSMLLLLSFTLTEMVLLAESSLNSYLFFSGIVVVFVKS